MRPVNLIPEDQRRGAGQKGRSGPLAFILVGALLCVLAGVTLLVSTGNQISSDKAEITELEGEANAAQAKVAELTPYTQLHEVHDQRVSTVTSLADSRFDWERVMRELSLILPSDVWLTNLTGTVLPEVSVSGSASVSLRSSAPGPALQMVGCATSQDAVASFVSRLKDIDGVTRVGLQFSKLGSEESGSSDSGSEGGAGSTCQTQRWISEFQIVAAFDAAPVPPTEASEAAESEIAAATAEESSSESSTESSEEGE